MFEIIEDISHVGDNLWQGSYPVGRPNHKFKWIINLASKSLTSSHITSESSSFARNYLLHEHQFIISTYFPDSEVHPLESSFIHGLADMVNTFRSSGPVLVHCEAGLNRSGLICALALMKKESISSDEAIGRLRQMRGYQVLFNKRFCEFLKQNEPEFRTNVWYYR